ncbi:hypothetical protein PNOK_0149700 [Pyrrhoderma noxium]|uniref:Uncharacterized protein n=1 Tax=Pyrrhoderma noxium TaxID=2282107 RepID=A0A286UPP5_9AGAM|nr:hypothetical protein PNOK_0149700 [Pyrrhoderma noxium]
MIERMVPSKKPDMSFWSPKENLMGYCSLRLNKKLHNRIVPSSKSITNKHLFREAVTEVASPRVPLYDSRRLCLRDTRYTQCKERHRNI